VVFSPLTRGLCWQLCLIDWAAASELGVPVNSYTGTVHYAATAVLQALATDNMPTPTPEHDLESLVYTIFDVTRDATLRPELLTIDRSDLNGIISGWARECQQRPQLATLVTLCRAKDYGGLRDAFLRQDCAQLGRSVPVHNLT
jgi:hypothetical protein